LRTLQLKTLCDSLVVIIIQIMKISFIGAGNVAKSLATAFCKSGHEVLQIYAPTREHAQELVPATGASLATSSGEIAAADTDFIIIATPDSAIENVAASLSQTAATVLHLSGSTDIDVLKPHVKHYGALYPLQTFSRDYAIDDFSEIPVFVEAESDKSLQNIIALAKTISAKVELMSSAQRIALHVAAVFACNFVNAMFADAFDLCSAHGVDPQHLHPLVEETVRKAFASGNPANVQTGPAKRNDNITINKHLQCLADEKREIYAALTKHIFLSSEYRVGIE
jgi:predicted short-subunit dehydrogenase-like oxidoreductase (DUF2520 family)